MKFEPTELPGVILFRPDTLDRSADWVLDSWEEDEVLADRVGLRFVQENQSRSWRHVLRGLHYQVVRPQGMLIRVIVGTVFHVTIDVRRSSPMFRRWLGVRLSAHNGQLLWVPPGFARGFLVLSDFADVVCWCTDFRHPAYERTIVWNDPDLNVSWPIPERTRPILSERDASATSLREAEFLP